MTDITKPKSPYFNRSAYFKFIIPSLIGIILFMTPIKYDNDLTIPVAVFSKLLTNKLADFLPLIMTIIAVASSIFTVLYKTTYKKLSTENKFLKNLFDVSPLWFTLRIVGGIFAFMTYMQKGPAFIYSKNTGGLLLFDLLPILFAVFLFAGLLLPLILDFGLLEFFGSILSKVMRPLFSLPGRSSIDCLTSWLGDGTIGVLLTSKQYEDGYYTKKEAAIIATNFSAVSITFSLVVISQVNLAHMFLPFYLTVTFAGFICAIVLPKLPPLKTIPQEHYSSNQKDLDESIPYGHSTVSWGLNLALAKAEKNKSVVKFFKDGLKNILDMWIGVTPIVMSMGTLALIAAEFTPVFQYLGLPFVPLLNLLHIPEASAASTTLVVGFADMFLPSVMAASIKSDLTRFVIGAISVTQLIYMSEVGGLILGSKIPLRFRDLVVIFIQRTLVSLPIITLAAHILF
jgi:nucleoside recognition membrane protein YjiH